MLFIVRRPDGQEIGIHADRLEVEATGTGKYTLLGPHGSFLDLPARKVDHIRLVDEAWPYPSTADEKP